MMKDERIWIVRLAPLANSSASLSLICARSLLFASSNAAVLVVLDFGYKFTQLFPTLQILTPLACENLLILRLSERKRKSCSQFAEREQNRRKSIFMAVFINYL